MKTIGHCICIGLLLSACREDRTELSDRDVNGPAPEQKEDFYPATKEVADSLFRLAEMMSDRVSRDSARGLHEKALEIRERLPANEDLVRSYHSVASCYLQDFKYPVADRYLEKARILGDSIAVDPELLINIYFDLADCKINVKEFPMALTLFRRLFGLITNHFPKRDDMLANFFFLLGKTYYYNGEYQHSIENILKAISLAPPSDHRRLSAYYMALGMTFNEIDRSEAALSSLDESIRHVLQWEERASDAIAIRYVQKAAILTSLEKYDSAYYYWSRNLAIRRKVYGEKHVNTFGARYTLAQFYMGRGSLDSAAVYFQTSLVSLIRNFEGTELRQNPVPLPDEINTDLIIALVGKGSVLHEMFRRDTSRTDLLELSLSTYVLADSVFTVYRRNFVADGSQLSQLETRYVPYDQMMDVAIELFTRSKERKFFEKALAIVEKSRAVVLQDAVVRAASYGKAGVPERLHRQENALISARQSILQQLSREPLQPEADSLYDELLKVNDRHQQLLDEIAKINPQYFSIRYNDQRLDIESLKAFLASRNSILIEYLWGEERIYALTLGADIMRTRVIPMTPAIRDAIAQVSIELNGRLDNIFDKERHRNFCTNSNFLYQALIAEQLAIADSQQSTRVIISADGALQSFPFETLIRRMPPSREVSYHLPYLFRDYTISYTFSSNLLIQSDDERGGGDLLAFAYAGGDSVSGTQGGLPYLPGTARELTLINDILGNDGANVFHAGRDASEAVFKEEVGRFRIVHLALHGVADTVNSMESHLIFRTDDDSLEDGKLYSHELYKLDLRNLDFAVLSACESGIGKVQSGEGVMSIARSFAYGGCLSQVISLWKLNDDTSAKIIGNFYKHLTDGDDIDVSLAAAKREYLAGANSLNSHPAYWAALIHIGNTSALFDERDYRPWFYCLAALVALLVVARRWRIKSFPAISGNPKSRQRR